MRKTVRVFYEEIWNAHNPAVTHPESVERTVSEFMAAFPDLIHTVVEQLEVDFLEVLLFGSAKQQNL